MYIRSHPHPPTPTPTHTRKYPETLEATSRAHMQLRNPHADGHHEQQALAYVHLRFTGTQ
jgi:hypothetical protein